MLIDFAAVGIDRSSLMGALRDAGIGTQVHYIPVHLQPYYRNRYGVLRLPGAERFYERAVTLPLFPSMQDADVDRVVAALQHAVQHEVAEKVVIMTNISRESVSIFTETPHADTSLDSLKDHIERSFFPRRRLSRVHGSPVILISPGKTAFDAGCGSGLKTIRLAHAGAKKIIGVDGSPVAIEHAQALAAHFGFDNAIFMEGFLEDLNSLLAKAGPVQFDYILSSQNIHHVTDWEKVLTSYARYLAPGGCLSVIWVDPWRGRSGFMLKNKISYWLGKTPAERLKIGRALFGWRDRDFNVMKLNWDAYYADRYAAFYHWIPLRRMRQVLECAGLEIVDVVPPSNAKCWSASAPDRGWRVPVKRVLKNFPAVGGLFTLLLRLSQFLRFGDTRTVVARKTVVPFALNFAIASCIDLNVTQSDLAMGISRCLGAGIRRRAHATVSRACG